MDYSKIYIELVERSFERELDCYTEKHHIIPRCMGGDNKERNLAILTPEEHYLAHQLLVKIYPDNKKLIYAAHMMCSKRPNNKLYGWLRRKSSEAIIGNKIWLGKTHSIESREKISKANIGKSPSIETRLKLSEAGKGRTHSPETKLKMAKIKTGKIHSDESKLKMSESKIGNQYSLGNVLSLETRQKISKSRMGKSPSNKGIPMSDEQKLKLSEATRGRPEHNKGVPMSEEQKLKISETLKGKASGNKGMKMSPESIAKRTASRKLNRELKLQQLDLT